MHACKIDTTNPSVGFVYRIVMWEEPNKENIAMTAIPLGTTQIDEFTNLAGEDAPRYVVLMAPDVPERFHKVVEKLVLEQPDTI